MTLMQQILLALGTGCLLAAAAMGLIRPIPLVIIGVVCLLLLLLPGGSKLQNFLQLLGRGLRQYGHILLFLVAVFAAVLWIDRCRSEVPRDVETARARVLRIYSWRTRRALTTWTAVDSKGRKIEVFLHGYDVVETDREKPVPMKTYIENGRRIAEDIGTDDGFVRRFYRGNCNFASDYYDKAGTFSYLEYDKDCDGDVVVRGKESPASFPPLPGYAYR